jgi:ribosomal protein S18 acetylase RimI-like enzyme
VQTANDDVLLVPASSEHVLLMMSWFPSPESSLMWGGWEFRFPFTPETFLADMKLATLPSYVLIRPVATLCAFGQIYLRAGRCHLARLAVAPELRGQGLGTQLIHRLMQEGRRRLAVQECSLFVHTGNPRALALYERLGFRRVHYPEADVAQQSIHYLIAP